MDARNVPDTGAQHARHQLGQERPRHQGCPGRQGLPDRQIQRRRSKADEGPNLGEPSQSGRKMGEPLPENHDGETPSTGELRLDPEPEAQSYTQVLAAPQVDGGTATAVRRQSPGENGIWAITITPSQGGDITVRLPSLDCGQQDAICIDGESLS